MRGFVASLPLAAIAVAGLCLPVAAADSLGVYDNWGVFRDPRAGRCYAIAEPVGRTAQARPFASVGYWPRSRVRGQFYARIGQPVSPNGGAMLTIGARSFALVGADRNLWAGDQRADAGIVAAIRANATMTLTARTSGGSRVSYRFALKGAATAIDAAALACARTG